MVTHEMCEAGATVLSSYATIDEVSGSLNLDDLAGEIFSAMEAARPTADLGEDLAAYRAALVDAFGTLHYIFETTDDDHVGRKARDARDNIEAALSGRK